MSQTIRLKEGETSIVSGLIDRELTKTITGIPGLAKLPGAGYLFGLRNDNLTDDELLILITPRKLRFPTRESLSIYAGRGEPTGRTGSLGPAPGVPERPEQRRPLAPPAEPGQPEQQPPVPPPQQAPVPEPEPQPPPEPTPPPVPPGQPSPE
jgi:general secretion pathway protein D